MAEETKQIRDTRSAKNLGLKEIHKSLKPYGLQNSTIQWTELRKLIDLWASKKFQIPPKPYSLASIEISSMSGNCTGSLISDNKKVIKNIVSNQSNSVGKVVAQTSLNRENLTAEEGKISLTGKVIPGFQPPSSFSLAGEGSGTKEETKKDEKKQIMGHTASYDGELKAGDVITYSDVMTGNLHKMQISDIKLRDKTTANIVFNFPQNVVKYWCPLKKREKQITNGVYETSLLGIFKQLDAMILAEMFTPIPDRCWKLVEFPHVHVHFASLEVDLLATVVHQETITSSEEKKEESNQFSSPLSQSHHKSSESSKPSLSTNDEKNDQSAVKGSNLSPRGQK